MADMSARSRFTMAAGVIVVSIAGLIAWSLSSATAYYVTPTELASGEKGAGPTPSGGGTFRVAGNVVDGSIERDGPVTRFALTDGVSDVTVTTRDVLPDTFAVGIETVAEGGLNSEGTFSASSVLVKCPSKFEAELASP